MDEKKRAPYEVAIVTVIVIITVVLAIGLFSSRARVEKGRLLVQELSQIRSSISVFNLLNKHYPKSLDELANSTYTFESTSRPYVEFLARAKDGGVVDPFGNPYSYDSRSGWVSSTTSGYQTW